MIAEHFVAVKLSTDEQPAAAEKYQVGAIPDTVLALPDGTAAHRFLGFLPPKAFLKELEVGVEARRRLAEVLKRLKEKPEDPAARLDFGTLYVGWGQWAKARAEFEAAAEATRDAASDLHARAVYQLGLTLLRAGDDAAAEKRFEALAAIDAPAAKALVVDSALERGLLLLDRGVEQAEDDPAAGRKLVEEARGRISGFLKEHPTHPRAAEGGFQLAYAYRLTDEEAKATAALRDLVEKHPDSPWAERAKKLLQGQSE